MAIAKDAASARKQAPDAAARMATDRLLRETYGKEHQADFVEALDAAPAKEIKNPKEYIVLEDTRVATRASGPMLIRRGTRVTNPVMIRILKDSNAKIKAIG